MNKICDNVSNCHELTTIAETGEAMRVFCNICQRQFIIKKDWRGVPENKYYSKIFRKEILQGNDPLFYKYHPEYLKI